MEKAKQKTLDDYKNMDSQEAIVELLYFMQRPNLIVESPQVLTEDKTLVRDKTLVEDLTKFLTTTINYFDNGKRIDPQTFEPWARKLLTRVLLAAKDRP